MKNEFIPYEQALALKGLGFDEPCFAWYNRRQALLSSIVYGFEEDNFLYTQDDMDEDQYIAPLYQQAFRWFREKHGLRHFIEYDNGHYNAVVQSSLVYHCDTHEEAELACLNRLIILITPITKP
jgi:hypothetical protein